MVCYMRENETFKKIFEAISPPGSDEEFISEVVRKSEYNAIKVTNRPMYAVSAALLAIVVLAVAVINLFGGNPRLTEPLPGGGSLTANADGNLPQIEAFGVATATAEFSGAGDSENPYNFKVIVNTFDDLEISVANISGTPKVMNVLLEAKSSQHFDSLIEFYERYPGIRFPSCDVTPTFLEFCDISCSYRYNGELFVEDGKVYWELGISNINIGEEIELSVYQMDESKMLHSYSNRGAALHTIIPHAIQNSFIAEFTANYEPSESFVTNFDAITGVNKIIVSDYSVEIYFSEYYERRHDKALWQGEIFEVMLDDRTILTLYSNIEPNAYRNVSESDGAIMSVNSFFVSSFQLLFSFGRSSPVGAKDIVAVIISGEVFELER